MLVVAVIGMLAAAWFAGRIGAKCNSCGARDRRQHAGAVLGAAIIPARRGDDDTCGACRRTWEPSALWAWTQIAAALLALVLGFLALDALPIS
jgi:hypothetical protein